MKTYWLWLLLLLPPEASALFTESTFGLSFLINCTSQNQLANAMTVSPVYCAADCMRSDTCSRFLYCPESTLCWLGGTGGDINSLPEDGCLCYIKPDVCPAGMVLNDLQECVCQTGYRGAGCSQRIRDCTDLKDPTAPDKYGMAYVFPDDAPSPILVYCDLMYGFTFLQTRWDSCTRSRFNRTWQEYRAGFGDTGCDYWLGLDNIHYLTAQGVYNLEVLIDVEYEYTQCYYAPFRIENSLNDFRATIPTSHPNPICSTFLLPGGGFDINGVRFSTKDHDFTTLGLPGKLLGGWWFPDSVPLVNPNGPYITKSELATSHSQARISVGGIYTHVWIKVLLMRVERVV